MKLFNKIKNCAEQIDLISYNDAIVNKFESTDFTNWSEKIKKIDFHGLSCHNDTTPGNASFTSLINLNKTFDHFVLQDRAIIQKSIFSDFFTLYIKSRVIVKIDNSKIEYPNVIIPSEQGYYDNTFTELWDQVLNLYPSAIYVPYILLVYELKTKIPHVNTIYDMFFGYEGDITKTNVLNEVSFMPNSK